MSAIAFAMPSRLSVSAFFTTGTIRPLPSASSTAKPRLTKLFVTILSPRSSPFTHGYSRSVSVVARAMNARYVGLTPYALAYSFFSLLRIATTFDMSTPSALVRCADVSSDLRLWSAPPRRIADIGSKFSPTVAPACAGGAAGAAAGAGGAGAAAGGGGAGGAGGGAPPGGGGWGGGGGGGPGPPPPEGGFVFFFFPPPPARR